MPSENKKPPVQEIVSAGGLLFGIAGWCASHFLIEGLDSNYLILICKILLPTCGVLVFMALSFLWLWRHCERINEKHSALELEHKNLRTDHKATLKLMQEQPNVKAGKLVEQLFLAEKIAKLS